MTQRQSDTAAILLPGMLMGLYWGLIKIPLPALPELAAHFHVGYHEIQRVFSSMLITTAAAALCWGPISDRFELKRGLCVILTILIVSCLLLSYAQNMITFTLLFNLCCAVATAFLVIARIMPLLCFPENETAIKKSMSYIMLIAYAVAWLAPLISGYAVERVSWHIAFLVIPAMAAIITLTVIFTLPRVVKKSGGSLIDNIMSMKRHLGLASFKGNTLMLCAEHFLPKARSSRLLFG